MFTGGQTSPGRSDLAQGHTPRWVVRPGSSLPSEPRLFPWPAFSVRAHVGEGREVSGRSKRELISCDEHPFPHWFANVLTAPGVYCRCLPGSRALAMTLTSGLVFTVFSDLNDDQAQEPVDPASI